MYCNDAPSVTHACELLPILAQISEYSERPSRQPNYSILQLLEPTRTDHHHGKWRLGATLQAQVPRSATSKRRLDATAWLSLVNSTTLVYNRYTQEQEQQVLRKKAEVSP